MADIDVVKKSSSAWVWILLVILLAVALWFLFGMNRNATTTGHLQPRQPLFAAASAAGPASLRILPEPYADSNRHDQKGATGDSRH
jgi:hypothetical protein